ncbi:MAG: hypothetical protein D6675_13555 [Gemmatimonadetes bacterium]|nr:MAG: hypothetical protein D6675_13555 [Gemmatimonadota bacterium]
MKYILRTIPLIIVLVFTLGAKHDQLIKDMVKFDKAYVPALVFTNQNNVASAKKAMHALQTAWQSFKSTYYTYTINDPLWQTNLDEIELRLNKAQEMIDGGNLTVAHNMLEAVRWSFQQLRARNQIDYLMDDFTMYHDYMTQMATLGAKSDLSDTDLADLENGLFPQADQLWQKIEDRTQDAKQFGMSSDEFVQFENLIKTQRASLDQLQQAIKNKNKAQIKTATQQLKPNFAKLFMLFGNFDGLQ